MALVSAIQSLAFARDLSGIQDIVRREARALTGADGAAFVLREGETCHYLDEDAIAPLWKGKRFPLDACVSGWTMKYRKSAVIPDIYADPRVPVEAYRPTFVRSMAMVPIRSLDPMGAIGIYWSRSYRATEQELRELQALADATALALENVMMYGELEDRVRERTRELEQAREAAQRALEVAELSHRSNSRFLATASHDLRQPLQVLALLNGSLREMVQDPEARHVLQQQEHAITTSSRLVNTLLDMSKLESGSIRPEITDFSMAGLVDELRREYVSLAESGGLAFQADTEDVRVRSDRVLVAEILGDLLSNAFKYTREGSVTLHVSLNGGIVSVEVRDTGIGMSHEQQQHIFEEFYQAAPRQPGGQEGFGLGLSIVDRTVRLLDLDLAVRSEPGRGSVFTLQLPAAER